VNHRIFERILHFLVFREVCLFESGARVFVTLLHEMQKRNAKKGLATLCIGGGMGIALTVER